MIYKIKNFLKIFPVLLMPTYSWSMEHYGFINFPPEVLTNIARMLSIKELAYMLGTCKTICKLDSDGIIWADKAREYFGDNKNIDWVKDNKWKEALNTHMLMPKRILAIDTWSEEAHKQLLDNQCAGYERILLEHIEEAVVKWAQPKVIRVEDLLAALWVNYLFNFDTPWYRARLIAIDVFLDDVWKEIWPDDTGDMIIANWPKALLEEFFDDDGKICTEDDVQKIWGESRQNGGKIILGAFKNLKFETRCHMVKASLNFSVLVALALLSNMDHVEYLDSAFNKAKKGLTDDTCLKKAKESFLKVREHEAGKTDEDKKNPFSQTLRRITQRLTTDEFIKEIENQSGV